MKKLMLIIVVILVLSFALLGQEAEAKKKVEDASNLFLYSIIFGSLGITAAAIGGAFAQSKALRTAVENIGRNPAAADSSGAEVDEFREWVVDGGANAP